MCGIDLRQRHEHLLARTSHFHQEQEIVLAHMTANPSDLVFAFDEISEAESLAVPNSEAEGAGVVGVVQPKSMRQAKAATRHLVCVRCTRESAAGCPRAAVR